MVWVAISAIAVGIAGIAWIMGGNPPVMIYSAPILFVWGTAVLYFRFSKYFL